MKKYEIQHDLTDAILSYLASRPYQEVYKLIGGIMALKEIDLKPAQEMKTETVEKAKD